MGCEPELRSCQELTGEAPVCTENLNAGVVVVKSAQDSARTDHTGSLNRAEDRRILVQGSMRSDAIVIARVRFQDPTQVRLFPTRPIGRGQRVVQIPRTRVCLRISFHLEIARGLNADGRHRLNCIDKLRY